MRHTSCVESLGLSVGNAATNRKKTHNFDSCLRNLVQCRHTMRWQTLASCLAKQDNAQNDTCRKVQVNVSLTSSLHLIAPWWLGKIDMLLFFNFTSPSPPFGTSKILLLWKRRRKSYEHLGLLTLVSGFRSAFSRLHERFAAANQGLVHLSMQTSLTGSWIRMHSVPVEKTVVCWKCKLDRNTNESFIEASSVA